ncbi:MAG: Na+/H+ antiporter NhaA [Hyphomicrobiaceae bacterium]
MKPKLQGALRFIQHEATGGLLLVCAAAVAMVLENSSAAWAYDKILETHFSIGFDGYQLDKSVLHWINDGLMAIFFFLIGLEIKRELMVGELSSLRRASLPAFAAIGGMVIPACVYAALNYDNPEVLKGWAIPTATDIAFAVGVMALLGSRVPATLKIFMLALAIIDDLGAIIIIAIFYTSQLSTTALGLAAVGCVALVVLNALRVTRIAPYVLVGFIIWVCVLKSGVHATLAGVVAALAIPLRASPEGPTNNGPLVLLEEALHPWIKYLVLPMFAFANAGVSLTGVNLASFLGGVPLAIAAGLFIGKPVGIYMFSRLAVKLGFAEMPADANWGQILGVAWLAGIGFTMSLFIGMLAFPDPSSAADIRIGVLAGSLLSAVAGFIVLSIYSTKSAQPLQQDTAS